MSNPDPIVLHVPGREVPAGAPIQPHSDIAQFFKIEEKKAFTVEALLRGAPIEAIPFNVKPDDIVELEYEGDLYRWMRADQLRDDLQKGSSLRAAESSSENKLTIPPDFGAPPTRGGLDLLLKGLKVLGIDPVGQVAKLAVQEVISKFEDSIRPAPGLYVLSDPGTIERQVHDKRDLDTRAPYLLFLHGTASSVAGSFSGLVPGPNDADSSISADDWKNLREKYSGHILGPQN